MAEGGGFGFAEGAEFAGAALDRDAGDFACERGGFGAGTLGKRENVQIGEGKRLDKGERGGVVVFGFAGKAGDDVGADGRVREALADEFDAAGVVLGAVPAVHRGEDAIGAGLQGHVEVLGDAIGRSEETDEIFCNVERFDGADAEAFDGCFLEDAAEEVFELDAGREIAAVGAEVDAAEDDFAVSRLAEVQYFPDDRVRRQAAAPPANKRNHAVGAAGVAAVLDLEGGAGVVPFPAEDGGGEKFGAVEDVAGEDLRKLGRSIPTGPGQVRRPYKRMKRNSRTGMQSSGGKKAAGRFSRRGGRERIDELGDLRLVGIADDPGDAGECGQFFGSALGITTSDDNADGGFGGVKLSNGVPGLSVGGGRDGAGVHDDDVGGCGRVGGGTTAIEQLALEGRAIGLRGAATELLDEEARHLEPQH